MLFIPRHGTESEELGQWSFSEPLSCLRQSAFGDVGIEWVRQGQIEVRHDFRDGLMSILARR